MSQQERTAASGDGRTFELVGGRATTAGDVLVVATAEAGSVIVQATEPTGGVVLGLLPEHDGSRLVTEVEPFEASPALDATEHELSLLQRATGADLPVGAWAAGNGGAPALLRSSGFNRHTFLCGQSGSGKTYALGVVLEQILLGTGLRMAILDPNADFVRLREPVPGADPAAAAAISAADIRVLGSVPPAEPLRMRFATMPRQAQAAVLQLDPLADRDEYNLFLHTFVPEPGSPTGDVASLVTGLLRGGEDERALAQRIENLGLPEWDVWALELPSASEIVSAGARVTVLDLAGFHDPRESSAVCLDLVESLWAERHQRTPTLIVIDEAHNLCPAEPSGSIQERLVERLVQIAAEGRKYGLWLLLSTQRPSKVHPQVLSQCDNLMLMRMNSPADVAEVAGIFGFAPPAMVAAAPYFRQGEAVMAGRFVPCPMRVRMGARLTVEGGSDVAVPGAGA